MKPSVDYLLVGTGVAPLLAAQRLSSRGDRVMVLNPDSDFFLENSELPLDLLSFETTNHDIGRRFANNTPDQVYRDLISEFPGAIEIWKEEDEKNPNRPFQVESAPWVRSRHRMWLAQEKSYTVERVENLYLRLLELGLKPRWFEGSSLIRQLPGFTSRNLESRKLKNCVGFIGPRFGDVDVNRYRTGLLEFIREKLGRDHILTNAHLLDIDESGVDYQLVSGPPRTIEVKRAVLYFWTPKLERLLRGMLEKNNPRMLGDFDASVHKQTWEEWEILSRDPVNPHVVAHLDGLRIWAHGEGVPPPGGWNLVKIMRRDQTGILLGEQSFNEVSDLVFQYLGWDRFTMRKMTPRTVYRWNRFNPIEFEADGVRSMIIQSCDGPLHWIARQVRQTIDQV
jgi:hypothetical protein